MASDPHLKSDPEARRQLSWASRLGPIEYFLIVCAALVAYIPALSAQFVWDDNGHVTKPALRSLHGLREIWFKIGATQQYYPILHSAFWLQHRLWADTAWPYHLVNILLHGLAASLFAFLLRKIGASGAFLAGLLFALHPVCVESVAWVSEEKNTLSACLYLASALFYFAWRQNPPKRSRYAWALLFFILAVLTKSVACTLPAALLVVVWWQTGRLCRRDIAPLLPWIAIGVGAGLFTAWVEHTFIGARGPAYQINFAQRIILSGRAVWFYLGKLAWPSDLRFVYPRWLPNPSHLASYRYPFFALVAIGALWAWRQRSRAPLAAFLFFVGTLFPALGFFDVFPFLYSFVADHFQYLAMLGIVALAAAGIERLKRAWGTGLSVGILALFSILTWRQAKTYANNETLYRSVIARDPDSWMPQVNLGGLLSDSGRAAEAIPHFEAVLRLRSDFPEVENDLGVALSRVGWKEEALAHYRKALQLRPGYPQADYNLAETLVALGRKDEAIVALTEALHNKPDYPEARALLALCTTADKSLPRPRGPQ